MNQHLEEKHRHNYITSGTNGVAKAIDEVSTIFSSSTSRILKPKERKENEMENVRRWWQSVAE